MCRDFGAVLVQQCVHGHRHLKAAWPPSCAGIVQVKRCADVGADLVRITVQGMQEAKACGKIRDRLFQDGCATDCQQAGFGIPSWT